MKRPLSVNQLASVIWSGANRAVRYAQKRGWYEPQVLPVRTIGIGNLQAGGAGKTPLAIRLARDAIAQGWQVAVLMRGYRGAWEKSGGILSPFEPAPSPGLCGDEAALIRDQAPGVWIGVGADRITQYERLNSAAMVHTGRPFDLVLLDDAFQHWKIRCDRYLVAVTDAQVGDRVFREDYRAVQPDDVVVLTKGDSFPVPLAQHPRRIRVRYAFKPVDPSVRYRFVAAIADPERARKGLEAAGYQITDLSVFPDHYAFNLPDVEKILEEASSTGSRVLLTGKDWVKWRALGIGADLVDVVEPEVQITEGEALWRRLLAGTL